MSALLGMAALAACFAGWFLLLRVKLDVPLAFVPSLAAAGAVCVLFCAGLLNFLPLACWLLLASGLGCLAFFIWKLAREKRLLETAKEFLHPAILLLAAGAVFFAVIFRSASLTAWDDYSHWAAMVKEMTIYGRLPNFETRLITHQNYPPGSALFLYFVTQFIGLSDGRLLLAQNLLSLSCLCSLFAFVEDKGKWVASLFIAGLSVFILGMPGWEFMAHLMVDVLLPLAALAATLIIFRYREDPRRAALFSAPLMTLTLLIKSSGVLFVAADVLLLCFLAVKASRGAEKPKKWKTLGWVALGVAIPFLALWLWNGHVDLVYAAAADTRHAMRWDSLMDIFRAHDGGEWGRLTRMFLADTFSARNRSGLVLILCNLVLGALLALSAKGNRPLVKKGLGFILAADLLYAVYMVGLLAMYLFSVWFRVDTEFPSITRYRGTIAVYLCGLFGVFILWLVQTQQGLAKRAVSAGLAALWLGALLYGDRSWKKFWVVSPDDNRSLRFATDQEAIVSAYGYNVLDHEYSYLIYLGPEEEDPHMAPLSFLNQVKYTLMSQNITLLGEVDDLEEWRDDLPDYYFLLVMGEDEKIRGFLDDYGVTGEIQPFYLVEDLLSGRAAN